MRSPWLEIPLEDYEAYMALPAIGQAPLLVEELEIALRQRVPDACAIVGCAGGNGLEEVALARVRRIVGIDVNPAYVAAARQRYETAIPGLELHVADIEQPVPACAPVDCLYAGLLFEYVAVPATLATLRTLCRPGGSLVVVLQRAQAGASLVSVSPYASLAALVPVFQLRDPAAFRNDAMAAGFELRRSRRRVLPSGWEFEVLSFVG